MARSRTNDTLTLLLVLGLVTTTWVPAAAQDVPLCDDPDDGSSSPALEKTYTDLLVDMERVRLRPADGAAQSLPLKGVHYLGAGPGDLLFDLVATNNGTGSQPDGDVTVRIRITPPSGAATLRDVEIPIPDLDQTSTAPVAMAVSGAGRHVIELHIDPDDTVAEECSDDHPNPRCGFERCHFAYTQNNLRPYGLLIGALPDLLVTQIHSTGPVRATSGASPDARATITATVQNDGPIPAYDLRHLHPKDGPLQTTLAVTGCDCDPVALEVPWIAPGATRTFEATLPVHGLAGSFETVLTLDPDGQVAVATKANKVHKETFDIPTADLTATVQTDLPVFEGRAVVAQGAPLEFDVRLHNIGAARAASTEGGTFTVRVTRDDGTQVATHKTRLDALSTLNLTIRDDTANLTDRHEYHLHVDSLGHVLETDEVNNRGTYRIIVAQYRPMLEIKEGDDRSTLPPGATGQVPFAVTNGGTVPDTLRFTVPMSDRPAAAFIDMNGHSVDEVPLEQGEVYKGALRFDLPRDAVKGDTFMTTLQVLSAGGGDVSERDLTFTIGDDTEAPTITLEDPSSGFLSSNDVVVRVVDNVDVERVETDISGSYQPVLPDEPDGSLYTIDVSGMPASFELNVRATDGSGNVEDETFELRRDTTPPRIAEITFIPDRGVEPGDKINVLAEVRDDNIDKVTARIIQGRGAGDVYIEEQTFTRFPTTFQLRDWVVPERPGHYIFNVTAHDKAGNVAHEHENLFVPGLDLQAPPNFFRPIISPAMPSEGERVRMTWMVQNTSPTYASGGFFVVLVLDDRRQIGIEPMDLGPGEIRPVTFDWVATPGPHVFSLVIDQANEVSEDDETLASNVVQHTTESLFPDHPLFEPLTDDGNEITGWMGRLLEYWYFPLLVAATAGLFLIAIVLGRRTGAP